MNAARLTRQGAALEIIDAEVAAPGRAELSLRPDAYAVCYNDLHIRTGSVPVAGLVDSLW